MSDNMKHELNLEDLEFVNGGVMFNGHDYTPAELLELYNQNPDAALGLAKLAKQFYPKEFAQAVAEIKASGLTIPEPILKEFGEYFD